MTIVRGRSQNFITQESHSFAQGMYDTKIIPAGTFVRPIEYCYVPKHVKDDPRWRHFDQKTEIFCYCSYGMVPILREKIRVAE